MVVAASGRLARFGYRVNSLFNIQLKLLNSYPLIIYFFLSVSVTESRIFS